MDPKRLKKGFLLWSSRFWWSLDFPWSGVRLDAVLIAAGNPLAVHCVMGLWMWKVQCTAFTSFWRLVTGNCIHLFTIVPGMEHIKSSFHQWIWSSGVVCLLVLVQSLIILNRQVWNTLISIHVLQNPKCYRETIGTFKPFMLYQLEHSWIVNHCG